MFKEVLEKIRPKPREIKKASKIAEDLRREILKQGYESVVVGSRSRNTFLSGSRDLDIFVYMPDGMGRKEFEKEGLRIGKTILKKHKPRIHYAEHPYVKGIIEGLEVEIVPCYEMKYEIISAVDRSPLHDKYLKEKIKGKEDEVLLLKQFLKTNKLYGANQKTHGFSGVLCETLILYFGSFEELVKTAWHWNRKTIIDVENLRENYYKFPEPLVVVDPVDKQRNMAAAVSMESFSKFVLLCQQFNSEKTISFFLPKEKKMSLSKAIQGRNLVIMKFDYPKNVIEEIAWGQLEKLASYFEKQLELNDFRVYKKMHYTDEKKYCWVLLELDTLKLSRFKKHKGPSIFDETNSKRFIETNKKHWVEDHFLFAWREREKTDVEDIIMELSKTTFPSHLKSVLMKAKVLTGREVLKEEKLLKEYFS